jgi:hypothetical protein
MWARSGTRPHNMASPLEDAADLQLKDESSLASGDGKRSMQTTKSPKILQKPLSSREAHEKVHWTNIETITYDTIFGYLTKITNERIRAGYLFNCQKNQNIVAGDPWLQEVWAWVGGW